MFSQKRGRALRKKRSTVVMKAPVQEQTFLEVLQEHERAQTFKPAAQTIFDLTLRRVFVGETKR